MQQHDDMTPAHRAGALALLLPWVHPAKAAGLAAGRVVAENGSSAEAVARVAWTVTAKAGGTRDVAAAVASEATKAAVFDRGGDVDMIAAMAMEDAARRIASAAATSTEDSQGPRRPPSAVQLDSGRQSIPARASEVREAAQPACSACVIN